MFDRRQDVIDLIEDNCHAFIMPYMWPPNGQFTTKSEGIIQQ